MSESLTSLSGKWTMNRDASSDVSDVLEIQGFNAITRKIAAAAPVSLDITQKGKEEVHIKQSTAASIPAVQEEWYLDWKEREQKDSFLGKVKSKSRWISLKDIDGGFLSDGVPESHGEVIEAEVESLDSGWKARQIWYIAEDGSFRRNVVTTGDGDKRAQSKLIYERK